MNENTYSYVLKYTRLIVAVALILLLAWSFYHKTVGLEDLIRAVMALLALNNTVGAIAAHGMNGKGKGA